MTLTAANFIEKLETFHGREFKTVFRQSPFTLLFHDTTKLRIRLPDRDISVPISILLLGINQLLSRKEFSRERCLILLGKEWGYPFVARLLLECDDVILKPNSNGLILSRIKLKQSHPAPVKAPEECTVAVNPANGNGRK